MDDRIFNFLSKIYFLTELSPQELMELSNEFHWTNYPEGHMILEVGQELPSLYILYEGNVEVRESNANYQTRKTYGTGYAFGGLLLVTQTPSDMDVKCLEPCRLLVIEGETFLRILGRWPQIYRSMIHRLTENLNEVNQQLSDSKYKEDLYQTINLVNYRDKFYGIWGSTKTTNEVQRVLQNLEGTKGNLLIMGERGTGRQMLAWYAHLHLFGEDAPFVDVDGRHFDKNWSILLEQNGPTGEKNGSPGNRNSLFDIAKGGTLFIQEFDQLTPVAQLKLAQKLESSHPDCRVMASFQTQPNQASSVIIPELQACFQHSYLIKPLRERKRDISIIAQGILDKLALENKRVSPKISSEATQLLLSHHYRQGNITELIRVMERAFFLANEDTIGLEQIFFGPTSERFGRSINLLHWKWFARILKEGSALFALRWLTAGVFLALIIGLLTVPQIMISTHIFTLVWGLWWPALAVVSPFIGRVWCTICPFSTIMDFVQDKFQPKRHIPDLLIKKDYLIVTLLFLAIFWVEVLTGMRFDPWLTGVLLSIILLSAVVVGILYTRHAWCRHLCPLGGFIGTAAVGSMLEVRADPAICLNKCTTLDCYVGKGEVKGCPMSQHLPYLDNNLDCKLCFNCVRNCPHDSIQVNLRVFAREVWHMTRINQGYAFFIGAMLGILFPLIYFDTIQSHWSSGEGALSFSFVYFASAFVGGAVSWQIAKPFKTKTASIRIKMVFALIPLIIGGHIIYQLRFVPGIDLLELGIAVHTSAGLDMSFIPMTTVAQGGALLIGVVLTVLTIVILLIIQKNGKKDSK